MLADLIAEYFWLNGFMMIARNSTKSASILKQLLWAVIFGFVLSKSKKVISSFHFLLSVFGCQFSAVKFQLSTFGFSVSTFRFPLSSFCCQIPTFHFRFSVFALKFPRANSNFQFQFLPIFHQRKFHRNFEQLQPITSRCFKMLADLIAEYFWLNGFMMIARNSTKSASILKQLLWAVIFGFVLSKSKKVISSFHFLLSVFGCQFSAVKFQLSTFGFSVSTFRFPLSSFCCQIPTFHFRFSVFALKFPLSRFHSQVSTVKF